MRGGLVRRGDVWFARKVVPADVRAVLGKREWVRTTGTGDARMAANIRLDLEREWVREIELARAALAHKPLDLEDCRLRINGVAFAGWIGEIVRDRDIRPQAWRPTPSTDARTTPSTILLLATLRRAVEEPEAWKAVPDFERVCAETLRIAEIEAHPTHPDYDALRALVVEAWLGSLEASERRRLTEATEARLRMLSDLDTPSTAALPATLEGAAYQPRHGDRTVNDLIEAFKAHRITAHGEASTERKYAHVFTALKEGLGTDVPIRALTREDARKFKALIARLPAHMGKRYPGKTMAEAIALADRSKEPVARLAPNTVNSYLSNLVSMLNFAIKEEWVEKNVAAGLIDKDKATVKRRGFTSDELVTLFGSLEEERKAGSWRWWIPALLLYTGARANEIAQLRRADVRSQDGIAYLALSEFDETGRRAKDKSLKTASSTRNVPLHAALIDAGVLDFVASAKDRLFPGVKQGPNGNYSHEVSKWFARHLDSLKLSDPALVLHSFRHGFSDACRANEISEEYRKAIGGWASQNVADRYGNPSFVPVLKREIERLNYGTFNLLPTNS